MEIAVGKYRCHSGVNAVTEKIEKFGKPTFGFDFYFVWGKSKRSQQFKNWEGFSKNRYSCKNCQGKYRYCFLFLVS